MSCNEEIPPPDLPQPADLPAVVVPFGHRVSLPLQKPDDLLKQTFPPFGDQGDVLQQNEGRRILLKRLQCQPDPPQGQTVQGLILPALRRLLGKESRKPLARRRSEEDVGMHPTRRLPDVKR